MHVNDLEMANRIIRKLYAENVKLKRAVACMAVRERQMKQMDADVIVLVHVNHERSMNK